MYIKVYNNDERSAECASVLASAELPFWVEGACLLPIPTSPDGVHLGRLDTRLMDAILSRTGIVYAGYEIPQAFADAVREQGGVTCDASQDESFLQDNAYLTALAALGYIIHALPMDGSRPVVGVVGYGRIGVLLVRMLVSLGLSVRVYTGREEVRLELGSLGIGSSCYGEGAVYDGLSMLVNTAPALTLCPPDDIPIFELAGGNNFPCHSVTRLAALPAKHYPRAAGRAWAKSIIRMLDASCDEGVGE